jgi:hypothetical protein
VSETAANRSDDLLVRDRVRHWLGEATARLRQLISQWRADRLPPSTREQPFPPAEVMKPIRRAERLGRAIDDVSITGGGLPLISQDRVRRVGLDELLEFDWTMVGESDALAAEMAACGVLDGIGIGADEERIKRLREPSATGAATSRSSPDQGSRLSWASLPRRSGPGRSTRVTLPADSARKLGFHERRGLPGPAGPGGCAGGGGATARGGSAGGPGRPAVRRGPGQAIRSTTPAARLRGLRR